MWMKRLVGAVAVVVLAAIATTIGVRGYGVFALEVVAVPVALAAEEIAGARIRARQLNRPRQSGS